MSARSRRLTRKQLAQYDRAAEALRALTTPTVDACIAAVSGMSFGVWQVLDDDIGDAALTGPAFAMLRSIRNTPGLSKRMFATLTR